MKNIIIALCLFAQSLSVYAGDWFYAEQQSRAKYNAHLANQSHIQSEQENRVDFAENLNSGLQELDQGNENSFIQGLFYRKNNRYADLLECSLGYAVVEGKINQVQKLLSIGVSASGKFRGVPLLFLACKVERHANKIGIMQLLLDYGANKKIKLFEHSSNVRFEREYGRIPQKYYKDLVDCIEDKAAKILLQKYVSSKPMAFTPAEEYCEIREFFDDEEVSGELLAIKYRKEPAKVKVIAPVAPMAQPAAAKIVAPMHSATASSSHIQDEPSFVALTHQDKSDVFLDQDSNKSYITQAIDFVKNNKVATTVSAALLVGLAYKFMQSKKSKKVVEEQS